MVLGIDAGITLLWRVGTFAVTHYKLLFLLFITFNILSISAGVYSAGRPKPLANAAVEFLFDYTWDPNTPLKIDFVSPECFAAAEEKDRGLIDAAEGVVESVQDVFRGIGDAGQDAMQRLRLFVGVDQPPADLTTIPLPQDTLINPTTDEIADAIIDDYRTYIEGKREAREIAREITDAYRAQLEGRLAVVDGAGGTTTTTSIYDITTSGGEFAPGSLASGVLDTVSFFAQEATNLAVGTYEGVTTFFSNIFSSSLPDQSGLNYIDLPTEVIKVGETKTIRVEAPETDPTFNDSESLEEYLEEKQKQLIQGKCTGFPLLTHLTQIPLLGGYLNSIFSIRINYPPLKLLFLAMKANLVLFGIILPFTSWTYNYYGAFKR